MKSIPKPNLISFDEGKYLPISQGIHIANDNKFFVCSYYPGEEFAEKGKRWIGNNDVGFITQTRDFVAAKISVTVKVTPFKVMEIYASVSVNVMVEHKYLSSNRSLVRVKLWCILLKKGRLIGNLVFLALRRV